MLLLMHYVADPVWLNSDKPECWIVKIDIQDECVEGVRWREAILEIDDIENDSRFVSATMNINSCYC